MREPNAHGPQRRAIVPSDDVWTVEQVASYFKVAPRTIRQWREIDPTFPAPWSYRAARCGSHRSDVESAVHEYLTRGRRATRHVSIRVPSPRGIPTAEHHPR